MWAWGYGQGLQARDLRRLVLGLGGRDYRQGTYVSVPLPFPPGPCMPVLTAPWPVAVLRIVRRCCRWVCLLAAHLRGRVRVRIRVRVRVNIRVRFRVRARRSLRA